MHELRHKQLKVEQLTHKMALLKSWKLVAGNAFDQTGGKFTQLLRIHRGKLIRHLRRSSAY